MLTIFPVEYQNSYTGLGPAGDAYVISSNSNADNVINDFEKTFMAGMNPNYVLQNILEKRNLTVNDFTDDDIMRVNRRVEAIYKTVDYQAWRQR